MEKLFVYGTLLKEDVRRTIFGREPVKFDARLSNFLLTKAFLYDQEFPIVIPHYGSIVDGLLLEVTPKELRITDTYEGDAYRRVFIPSISAWIYL